jgi:hypothetical protein
MARRKRKDEPDWVPPAFDEVSYMRKEIAAARLAMITIGWAFVGAMVSFLLSFNTAVAFLVGIAVAFGLYFVLPLLGIDIKPFKRRDWVGHGMTYFFSWLSFWILFLNPPFGDFTDPTIHGLSASPYRAGYRGALPCHGPAGGIASFPMGTDNTTVLVLFRATDNVRVSNINVTVVPTPPSASLIPGPPPPGTYCRGAGLDYPGGTYNVTFVPAGVQYTVRIAAMDPSGRPASASFVIDAE